MASQNPLLRFLGFIWSGIDGLRKVLHLVLLVVLFSTLVGAISGGVPVPPSNAALVLSPSGFLVDELEGDPFTRALAELEGNPVQQTLVRDITKALRLAADDDNVPAVVLRTDDLLGGGLTKLEDVARSMQQFRESGKKIYAYGSFFSQEGYYLAAHADEVWLHPNGGLFLTGYGVFNNYFKDALEKLKVDWNVFRVGTYKSYAEPYLRNDMSAEDREASQAWLDDLWSSYIAAVAEARDLAPEDVRRIADDLGATLASGEGSWADIMLEAGLVDALKNRNEVAAELVERFGFSDDAGERYNSVSVPTYLAGKGLADTVASSGDAVAVIVASGPVVNGEAPPGQIGGDSTAALIRRAVNDTDIKALVLRVDSGGGSVFASDVIQDELQAFKATGRPIVASMGSVAASAGYWISASADRIYASPNTITGSIGVVGMFPTFERSLASVGVYSDGVGTTALAGQFRADRALNPPARALIQRLIEDDYERFISGVARFRGIDKDAVDRIAQGRVWSGADALEIGLVDRFGGIDDAIEGAAELLETPLDSLHVVYITRELSPIASLFMELTDMATAHGLTPPARTIGPAERVWRGLRQGFGYLNRYNDPKGVYSECFCSIY